MKDMWGGRFREGLDDEARRFTSSLPFDVRLLPYDLRVSRAHARALRDAGVLAEADLATLLDGIERIESEARDGRFPPEGCEAEDIHSAVEARLHELAGEAAGKLHAGRSRNDQVATDTLLWLRDSVGALAEEVRGLQRALVEKACSCGEAILPGTTHLQRAQPILLAHHLLAHVEALERDRGRLLDGLRRADRCPLGAAALAGTSLPLDVEATARELGFEGPAPNSLDAVSDRDWAVEAAAGCALLGVHLSRIAGELVLWSTEEYGRARTADRFCTGSSIMPQKRNPDVAELVRARAARTTGDLVTLLSLLKGLPLGYHRDLQEDKEALFDAVDTATASSRLLARVVEATELPLDRVEEELRGGTAGATDLAELLVREGVPFREAHEAVGRLVLRCEEAGTALRQAPEEWAREVLPPLPAGWREVLEPRGSVRAKATHGSTNPERVAGSLLHWRERLGLRANGR